jgi:imidazolonepropionase-like amidohydrolase
MHISILAGKEQIFKVTDFCLLPLLLTYLTVNHIAVMNTLFPIIFILLVFACQPSPSEQDQSPLPTGNVVIFENVNVISMDGEGLLQNQYVVIEDDRIFSVSEEAPSIQKAQVIDGSGKYLLPGLAEMHAHIPNPDQGESLIEETLFLYLAAGVTTIRGMLGHPRHLELREQVENGSILGPRIYTSGPSINGNSAPDIETATAMVREQQAAGYDFLKLHPGIKLEVFDAIVATAKEVGIPYAGHVSREVGVRHAINSDYASIDHIDGYVEGLVPEQAGVDPEENGFFGINFTDLVDERLLPDLIKATIEHDVWIVPTQCLAERWAGPMAVEQVMSDPEMAYMSPETLEGWRESKQNMMSNDQYDAEKTQRWIDLRRRMIKEMFDSNAGVLLGSDAPQVFNVPGFAIQHEIEMYVAAGLTPYEALVTGTVNPARYFQLEHTRGKIKEGYQADLILVEGNPLENISNLEKRTGVMIRGKWLSREELDQKLAAIAEKYAAASGK